MGDLISRLVYKSDLLKMVGVLNKLYRKAILNGDNDLILAIQNKQSAYTTALRLLDYEPTAYDSREAIEELEKAIEIIKQNGISDDVCEWKCVSDGEFIQNPHTKKLYSNESSVQNVYCNTCGKKIKIVGGLI